MYLVHLWSQELWYTDPEHKKDSELEDIVCSNRSTHVVYEGDVHHGSKLTKVQKVSLPVDFTLKSRDQPYSSVRYLLCSIACP